MKKIFALATAAFLISGFAFAADGGKDKNKEKSKKTASGKTCGKQCAKKKTT
ncbi:MAG: hypothetical protein JST87_08745 [Bacteroidetes bacterium]|nr:hypothetical protein [Bacteroidota bacterium]MBS1932682.1 hypothetical protein [Bacteroidota bacterium]